MNQNPLEQYFRQPKIYITLPSLGMYSPPGTFNGSSENMPVYSMTGMDEIIIKTPDALMSGESNIKVIESCCPSIKNARTLSSLDTNLIFAAIRIATYGNNLSLTHTCPKCETVHDYELDLMKIVDFYTNKKYHNKIVVGDLVIKTQPTSFQQSIEFNIKNFEIQQQIFQSDKIENLEEKQKVVNKLWADFAANQHKLYLLSVESVETPTVTVSERGYVEEWLSNCDSIIIDKIKEYLIDLKKEWDMPKFPVECNNCNHKVELVIDLDYSNFFSKA